MRTKLGAGGKGHAWVILAWGLASKTESDFEAVKGGSVLGGILFGLCTNAIQYTPGSAEQSVGLG
jgi:hypothetical protein